MEPLEGIVERGRVPRDRNSQRQKVGAGLQLAGLADKVGEDPISQGLGREMTWLQLPRRSPGAGLLLVGSAQPSSCSPLGPWHPHPGSRHPATRQMAPGKAGAWGWATGLGQAVGSGHPGLRTDGCVCPQHRMLGAGCSSPLLLTKLGFKISPGCGQKSERWELGVPRWVPFLL